MFNKTEQVFIVRTTPIKCDFCPCSFLDAQGILRCESDRCKMDAETLGIMFRKIYDKKEVLNSETQSDKS